MDSIRTKAQYMNYAKPRWAPPSWVFGPVWSVLYLLIAISFGYVAYLFIQGHIPFIVLLPFILNIIVNAAYTFFQFSLRNFMLAAIDVLLVLATLVWALAAIYPYAHWVAYINIPYVLWVCFASVLQLTITAMNHGRTHENEKTRTT